MADDDWFDEMLREIEKEQAGKSATAGAKLQRPNQDADVERRVGEVAEQQAAHAPASEEQRAQDAADFDRWVENLVADLPDRSPSGVKPRADPRTFHDLSVLRTEVRQQWAPLVLRTREALQSHGDRTVGYEVAEDLFERVAGEALWVCTELRKGDDYKFIAQRYLSQQVHDWWLRLAQSRVTSRRQYIIGKDGRCGVRHEHVVPRANLMAQLRTAQSLDEVTAILSRGESCVVTTEEAKVLGVGEGWERYRRARIDVWDRKEQRWLGFR